MMYLTFCLQIGEDSIENYTESEIQGTPSISVNYDLFSGHKLDKTMVETNTDTDTEKLKSAAESSSDKVNEKVLKSACNAEDETTKIKTEEGEESNENEHLENQMHILKYPLGSVIATVEMIFTSDEEYLTAMPRKIEIVSII